MKVQEQSDEEKIPLTVLTMGKKRFRDQEVKDINRCLICVEHGACRSLDKYRTDNIFTYQYLNGSSGDGPSGECKAKDREKGPSSTESKGIKKVKSL